MGSNGLFVNRFGKMGHFETEDLAMKHTDGLLREFRELTPISAHVKTQGPKGFGWFIKINFFSKLLNGA
jgi:hypothetical protein